MTTLEAPAAVIDDDIDLARPLRVFQSRPALGVPFWRWECRACGDSGGGGSHPDAVGRALTHCVEHPSHPSSLVPPVNCRQDNPRAPLRTIYEWLVARSALEPIDGDQLPLLVDDPDDAAGAAASERDGAGALDDELASLGPVDVEWISAGEPAPAADLAALAWLAGAHAPSGSDPAHVDGELVPSGGEFAPWQGDRALFDGEFASSVGEFALLESESTDDHEWSGVDAVPDEGGSALPGGDRASSAEYPVETMESGSALVQRRLADGWARALPTGWPPPDLTDVGPAGQRPATARDGESGSAVATEAAGGLTTGFEAAGGSVTGFEAVGGSAVETEAAGGSPVGIEVGAARCGAVRPVESADESGAAGADAEDAVSASHRLPPVERYDGVAGLLEATETGSAGDRIAMREPVSGPMMPTRRFLLPTAGLVPIVPPAGEAAESAGAGRPWSAGIADIAASGAASTATEAGGTGQIEAGGTGQIEAGGTGCVEAGGTGRVEAGVRLEAGEADGRVEADGRDGVVQCELPGLDGHVTG